MADDLKPGERAAVLEVLAALVRAWARGDGAGFAAAFAEDADFINILGLHLRGRTPIAAQHDQIFSSIYRGSKAGFDLVQARRLGPDIIHAVIDCAVEVPAGPMAGRVETRASAVMVRTGGRWRIAAFHNTRLGEAPPH